MQERKGRAVWVLEGHDRTLRNTLKMHGNHRIFLINSKHRAYTNKSRTGVSINGSNPGHVYPEGVKMLKYCINTFFNITILTIFAFDDTQDANTFFSQHLGAK